MPAGSRCMSGGGFRRCRHCPTGPCSGEIAGFPQGSAVSPVLATLFMHYAFNPWLARNFPDVAFERYADGAVIHCRSLQQAKEVLAAPETGWPRSGCGCTRPNEDRVPPGRLPEAAENTFQPNDPPGLTPGESPGLTWASTPRKCCPACSASAWPRPAGYATRREDPLLKSGAGHGTP
jgi:hypothetical protein